MLYEIVKPLVNIFYRVYYTFEIKGKKKIPFGKPIMFSPNHTNGFVDPVVLAMLFKPKVRFFARGDVFKGKVLKWVLNDLNISPMYRTIDGYSDVKKNDKPFEECRNLLSENKIVMIYPEGLAVQEKRLQPLKKGLARIVFQTEESFDFKKNVWVVPVGMNYTDAKKFRSKLLMRVGEPISVKSFEKDYTINKVQAINEFTRMLEVEMRKLIITIDNKMNDVLVEGILEIYLQQWMKEKKYDAKSIEKEFDARKQIVKMINYHDLLNPESLESLKKKIHHYLKQINKHSLRDHLLRPETINNTKAVDFFLEFFIIWIGLPIYGIGLLTNYLPYYLSKRFVAKKIKDKVFIASVYAHMAMFLWLFYYGIQLLIVALVFRNWNLLAVYAMFVPLIGVFVLKYYPIMKKIFGRWRLLRLVRKDRKTVETLMHERSDIIEELNILKKEFLTS